MMRYVFIFLFSGLVFFLAGFNSRAQSPSYFLEIKVEYPSPGMSDGQIIPYLKGNYANPVLYKFDNSASIIYSGDTLSGLDEFYFQEGVIVVSALDSATEQFLCYAMFDQGLGLDFETTCDVLHAPFYTTDCDGDFNGNTTYTLADSMILWWSENAMETLSSVVYTGLDSMSLTDGLCPGFYELILYDGTGDPLLTFSFLVGSILPSSDAFEIEVFATPSSPDSCTGDGYATVLGAVPPLQYIWDDVPGAPVEYNLCEGLHTLKVIDNNNDSAAVFFGVADSSLWYSSFYTSLAVVDTIYFMTENCGLDFTIPVDSIFISYADFLNDSIVTVGFTIWQAGLPVYVQDTTSYGPPSYGTYLVDLTQFCLTKSLSGQVIKFNGTIAAYLDLEESASGSFTIFPNPSSNFIHIDAAGVGQVMITSVTGQTVLTTNQVTIDVSTFAKGLYQLYLFDEKGTYLGAGKFVVQ